MEPTQQQRDWADAAWRGAGQLIEQEREIVARNRQLFGWFRWRWHFDRLCCQGLRLAKWMQRIGGGE